MEGNSDDLEYEAGLNEQDESEGKDKLNDHVEVLRKFEDIRKEAVAHGTHPHAHTRMHVRTNTYTRARTRPRPDRQVRQVVLVHESADQESVSNSRCMALICNVLPLPLKEKCNYESQLRTRFRRTDTARLRPIDP